MKLSNTQRECLAAVLASPNGCGVIDGGRSPSPRRGRYTYTPCMLYVVHCPRAFTMATTDALLRMNLIALDTSVPHITRVVPTIATYTALAMA